MCVCGVGGVLGADLQSRVGRKPSLLTHAYHAAMGVERCYVVKPKAGCGYNTSRVTLAENGKSSASNTRTHTHSRTHT